MFIFISLSLLLPLAPDAWANSLLRQLSKREGTAVRLAQLPFSYLHNSIHSLPLAAPHACAIILEQKHT